MLAKLKVYIIKNNNSIATKKSNLIYTIDINNVYCNTLLK